MKKIRWFVRLINIIIFCFLGYVFIYDVNRVNLRILIHALENIFIFILFGLALLTRIVWNLLEKEQRKANSSESQIKFLGYMKIEFLISLLIWSFFSIYLKFY